MKTIVRRIATSCIPIVAGRAGYAFDPRRQPRGQEREGVGAKLEAGKHELDQEIDQRSEMARTEAERARAEGPQSEAQP